jgi:hypothetical protein
MIMALLSWGHWKNYPTKRLWSPKVNLYFAEKGDEE